ncbi:hypothetical protein M758_7G069100 [Ceratodon purpureus]|nr:hypothetical protein M758_7G069100 [Ceratodon purpureus]
MVFWLVTLSKHGCWFVSAWNFSIRFCIGQQFYSNPADKILFEDICVWLSFRFSDFNRSLLYVQDELAMKSRETVLRKRYNARELCQMHISPC